MGVGVDLGVGVGVGVDLGVRVGVDLGSCVRIRARARARARAGVKVRVRVRVGNVYIPSGAIRSRAALRSVLTSELAFSFTVSDADVCRIHRCARPTSKLWIWGGGLPLGHKVRVRATRWDGTHVVGGGVG